MDRDEAIISMVDSTSSRRDQPYEKARAYQMKTDAMKTEDGPPDQEGIAQDEALGISA